MRPLFGSLLYTLIDKHIDATWRLLFIKYAHQALKWEPRIRVARIVPLSVDAVSGKISIQIEYENLETKEMEEEKMYVAIAA
jgi:phage baseplate assembly protein W